MPPTKTPLLVIHNTHAASSGEPPHLTNADGAATYLGYFQSEHGDQWMFVYDHATGRATLYGGDVRWDRPLTVTSLQELPYHFTEAERRWVEACWQVAASRSHERDHRRAS